MRGRLRAAAFMPLVAGLLATLSVGGAGTATATALPVAEPRVTLLGDSTMLRMSAADQAIVDAHYDLLWDAKSCRRLVHPSCSNRRLGTPVSVLPLIQTTYKGRLGQALVLMAGYDDEGLIAADIDAIMAEATAQGVAHVIFLTYHSEVKYQLPNGLGPGAALYRRHNVELLEALNRHPTMQLIDWNRIVEANPNWVAADGIHLEAAGARGLAEVIAARLDTLPLGGCSSPSQGRAMTGPAPGAVATGDAQGFVGVAPVRVLDTRRPQVDGSVRRLGRSTVVAVDVAAVAPAEAGAVVATVTAVDPCAEGFLAVYPGPCTSSPPEASTVNFVAGRTTANLAITRLVDRVVCVYSSVPTHVVVDVAGWFAAGGSRFTPLTPTRVVDTRTPAAIHRSIVGERAAMSPTSVQIRGIGGVGVDASAVLVNLTAVGSAVAGYVSAYPGPCGRPPETSVLNTLPGRDVAGATIVPLGSDGSICVLTSSRMHLLVDVQGWFGDDGYLYQPMTPRRLVDSRSASALVVSEPRRLALTGLAMLNVAAVSPVTKGFLSISPCGARIDASVLNTTAGEPVANAAAIGPDAAGYTCLTSSLNTHVVVDVSGLFITE